MSDISNNDPESHQTRRQFLGSCYFLAAAFGLAGVYAPNFTLSPNEKADAWFDKKMEERSFVPSENGALFRDNVQGYWSGGPGASAQTIYKTLRGEGGRVDPLGTSRSHPWDADDFGRCVELLQAVPEWRKRIREMATVSPEWAKLVKNWDSIEKAFAAGNSSAVSRLVTLAVSARV